MLSLLLILSCTQRDSAATLPVVDVAPKALHRLNRAEYDNTVRDLLYTDLRPARDFPKDDAVDGFDNVATGLSMSPLLFELYESAADVVLDDLFGVRDEYTQSIAVQAEGGAATPTGGAVLGEEAWAFNSADSLSTTVNVAFGGNFEVSIIAFGQESEGVAPVAELVVDGKLIDAFDVTAGGGSATAYTGRANLVAGLHSIEARFANPSADLQRVLAVDALRVVGPTDPEVGRSVGYDKIVYCDPGLGGYTCSANILQTFAQRAWRRPLTADERDWVFETWQLGLQSELGVDDALKMAMKVILLSPDFIFRFERPADDGGARRLDGYEVASRLSYFLWSSMPDEELMEAAASGELLTPEGHRVQVMRLLHHDNASALVENFAGQWWGIRDMDGLQPDPAIFPDFDEKLRAAMRSELENMAIDHFFFRRPMREMLVSDGRWMDQRLATHYSEPFGGDASEWIYADNVGRGGGLLTTAGWLANQAHPDMGSAVARGKWVLDNLLCTPIPPPPPDGGQADDPIPSNGSARSQEESQRASEYCQNCHSKMDPVGFALHGFDGIGASRTVDEFGYPIDASTEMDSGVAVASAVQLQAAVFADERFVPCVVDKTWTYALGRPPRSKDAVYIDSIVEEFVASDYAFETLVLQITSSPPFRMGGVQ